MAKRLRWYIAGGIILVISALVLYGLFPPESSRLFPKCPFHLVTGLSCPGCGSQRMLHSLLTGNLAEAFKANALLFVSLPYLGALMWLEYLGGKARFPRIRQWLMGRTACLTAFTVIIIWWVGRNMFGI